MRVSAAGERQDYPKSLGPGAKVGFTSVDPWLCFSPCKNNTADAAKAQVGCLCAEAARFKRARPVNRPCARRFARFCSAR